MNQIDRRRPVAAILLAAGAGSAFAQAYPAE
jgi:hypothetical protein